MAQNGFPVQAMSPEMTVVHVRLLGTGAADPTKEFGTGVTATRVSQGKYRLTFSEHVGAFVAAYAQFAQAAPAAGGTNVICIDHDSYTASGRALDFFVEDTGTEAVAPALADLATTDKVYVQIWFKRTSA